MVWWLLGAMTGWAAPVAPDHLGEALAAVAAAHQAPFLIATTWDTIKPCQREVDAGLRAECRRVAEDMGTATAYLNDQLARGFVACGVYLGKSSSGNYALYPFGACDQPPVAPVGMAAGKPGGPAPGQVGTVGVQAVVAASEARGALQGVDLAAARAAASEALARWPSAEKPRYHATGTVRSAVCTGQQCDLVVGWSFVDGSRAWPVYEVATRGRGNGSAPSAAVTAVAASFEAALARPALIPRLDPSPPTPADPPPNWMGELAFEPCGPGAGVPEAAVGKVGTTPVVVLSPDGLALTSAAAASPGMAVVIGRRSVAATPVRVDHTLGLAVVTLAGGGHVCMPIAGGSLSAGARVQALGGQSGAVLGVQTVSALTLARSNLPPVPSATPVWDAVGSLRGLVSDAVSVVGFAAAPVLVPVSVVLDRLDLAPGTPASDRTAFAGQRGAQLPPPLVDAPDP